MWSASRVGISLGLLVLLVAVSAQPGELKIPQVLTAISLTHVAEWAEACSPESASNTIKTVDQGTFVICHSDDQATIKYFPVGDSLGYVLATFENIEHEPYMTRKIYTGNWCKEIGLKSGSGCYKAIAGSVASSFLPIWSNLNVSETMVSTFMLDNFAPYSVATRGVPSRCFSDTGEFVINGLASDRALLALMQRNYKFAGCDNSEGDNRFWSAVMWSWPSAFGKMIITIAVIFVSTLLGMGCCACAIV